MEGDKVYLSQGKLSFCACLCYTGIVIQRSEYIERLATLEEKLPVRVISGIRSCGKTTLLAMYIDWLKHSGVEDSQIVFVSLDDPESSTLFHYQGLYGYIKKRLCKDKVTYIFIDEIQKCADYERAVEGLLLKQEVVLYVTVSTTSVFSRVPYVEIGMLPLSFAEYLVFTKANILGSPDELRVFSPPARDNGAETAKPERRLPRQRAQMEKFLRKEAFNNYVSFGGFPFTAALGGDAALIRHYVDGIYNTILVKDLARQNGVHDIPLLEHIVQMMGHSTGRPLSSKRISATINAAGRKISTNTVETYIRALTTTFVFYHIERFDIKTGKYLKTLGKYYIADTGIRNLLLSSTTVGTGTSVAAESELDGQLENVVCLELLRRNFQVCTGKYGSDEVNFVTFARSPSPSESLSPLELVTEDVKPAYYQVAASVRDPAVLARKLSPLEQIEDNHPKYLLTLDETPFRSNYKGIIQKNLIDWLLETGA